MPLMLGKDRAKLSKRHGALPVLAYRERGILPQALNNFLARLGWSHGDQEIFSMGELIRYFDLDHVGKAPGVFDAEKLLWLNSHYIKETPPQEIAPLLAPFLPFNETDATQLIDTYLAGAGGKFLLSELNLIFGIAGYHPYFLQMACHHLFTAHQQGLPDAGRRQFVPDKMRSEAEPVFQDYWQNSSDGQKILLTVMAMRALEQQIGKDTLAELAGQGHRTDYSGRGPASKSGEDVVDNLTLLHEGRSSH